MHFHLATSATTRHKHAIAVREPLAILEPCVGINMCGHTTEHMAIVARGGSIDDVGADGDVLPPTLVQQVHPVALQMLRHVVVEATVLDSGQIPCAGGF